MLQQTQTTRVQERYPKFLAAFPTIVELAKAPLYEVLQVWEGMGYYRRAKNLHLCAQDVCDKWLGRIPTEYTDLLTLPGVGSYTAAAISNFAYLKPTPMIETNIRAVYTHTFFPHTYKVHDRQILDLVEQTIDRASPREWFYSLMDLGVVLKNLKPELNKRSSHYVRQSKFRGSNRELAAKILKSVLLSRHELSLEKLALLLDTDEDKVREQVSRLKKDKLIRVSCSGTIERF